MINLLDETIETIKESGLHPDNITYIGSKYSGHSCTWKEFLTLANVEYDDGYGTAEVAEDLVVIFKDGSKLHRTEYNGSEEWQFVTSLVLDVPPKPITKLTGGGWLTLAQLNNNRRTSDA